MVDITPKDLQRFWIKVKKSNNCWEWQASKNNKGYGTFWHNKKYVKAHRVSYELFKGLIPQDLTIDHLCRNRKCVNPEHLEAVTMKENTLRGIGFSAINKRKTQCPKGHPYSGDNLFIRKTGGRGCKICAGNAQRRHRLKIREAKKIG